MAFFRGEEGSVAYYDPIKDKLIYNYEKFEVGTSSHELVHMALRQYFNAQGQRMEINFRNRLEKEFELAFGVTLSQKLGQVVKREYKVDPTDLNKIETKYENLKEKVNKRYKNKKISKSEHKKEIKKHTIYLIIQMMIKKSHFLCVKLMEILLMSFKERKKVIL